MFRFANPHALWLLLLIVPLVLMTLRRRNRSVAFSSLELVTLAGLRAAWWKRHGKRLCIARGWKCG